MLLFIRLRWKTVLRRKPPPTSPFRKVGGLKSPPCEGGDLGAVEFLTLTCSSSSRGTNGRVMRASAFWYGYVVVAGSFTAPSSSVLPPRAYLGLHLHLVQGDEPCIGHSVENCKPLGDSLHSRLWRICPSRMSCQDCYFSNSIFKGNQ